MTPEYPLPYAEAVEHGVGEQPRRSAPHDPPPCGVFALADGQEQRHPAGRPEGCEGVRRRKSPHLRHLMLHKPVRHRRLLTTASLVGALMTTTTAACSQAPDLPTYAAIRQEGYAHSQVMSFAAELTDGFGARLTASPNLAKATDWARATLTAIGLSNVHLEDWGEFGTGWEQTNAWARMSAPDAQPLWLQAAPWSAPTPGPVTAPVAVIDPTAITPQDVEKLRGTLKGRIVLLGAVRTPAQPTDPFSYRYSDAELKALESDTGGSSAHTPAFVQGQGAEAAAHGRRGRHHRTVARLAERRRDRHDPGRHGADIVDEPWVTAKAVPIPHAVMMDEHYGRLARLVQHGVPVTMQLDIETRTTGDHQHGYNVLAEIPGTDPNLKAQVVLVGGHFDSWGGGNRGDG